MSERQKVIIASGGFDVVHVGHISYFKAAKALGDELLIILNSDDFLIRKKGFCVMSFEERKKILEAIKYVDCVIECTDKDDTVCETLSKIKELSDGEFDLIFAKGGDREEKSMPLSELDICKKLEIPIVYNVGGEKIQSPSWITERLRKYVK